MGSETINSILKFLNIEVPELSNRVGVSKELIYMIQKGKRNVSNSLANKIQDVFGIPAEYSKDGLGDLKIVNELIRKDPIVPTLSKTNGVPYYDVDFMGGFDMVFNDQLINPSFYIDFLPFNDADCWINVSGKSMGPLIAHGDIVALKQVHDWKKFLLEGEIYAIITVNEFRTIKIIGMGHDKDHYLLIPYNKSEEYRPQPIPKDVITHIFRVKGAIKKFF